MIELSFIVPIYNMEKYLEKCVSSIVQQHVEKSEIILVNDGSTDTSLLLCYELAEKYKNIVVIDKENGGISSARNAGLRAANGDYVCFVDSDDFFKENFANTFLEICYKERLDVIRGWYGIYDEEHDRYTNHTFPEISYLDCVSCGSVFLQKSVEEHSNEVVPWLGFFKRSYLNVNEIEFPVGIAYEEDHLFFLKTLLANKDCRVYQSDIEFYAYRKRAGSATKTPTLKQIKDILYVVEQETKLINTHNLTGSVKKATLRYICSSFYQLTSIYGRLSRADKDQVAILIPFWIKWQCICHPYDRHQQLKIMLFTFARWFVDFVYRRRGLR